jgi:hypothetical protein
MTAWKDFLKRKRGLVLTLPAAALWSLPIGAAGWEWIQSYAAQFASIGAIANWAYLAALPLTPIAAVCSTFAMLRFADDRDRVGNGLATLLFIFNLLTWFAAVSATTIGAMRLTGLVD